MSEKARRREPGMGITPRGPVPRERSVVGSSWEHGDPAVLAEHRNTLAAVESDVAYRWISPAAKGRNVLDVNAGAGYGSAVLRQAGASSVIAIDPDPRAVEIATRLHGEGVRFSTDELIATRLADGSFDLVVCFDGDELARHETPALDRLTRLLTDGGILALSLPIVPLLDPISGLPIGPGRDVEGWTSLLRQRFTNVRVHRRRSSFAATVVPDENGKANPEIGSLSWLGADRWEERSILAVATNADELPDLPTLASVVGARDIEAYRDTIAAWEQRARRAEADGAAKHWELVASREAQRRLRKRLWDLEHTPVRKLFRVLRGKPARLSEGPPIRPPELEPEAWD